MYIHREISRYIYIYRVCFHNPKPVQNIPSQSLWSAEQRSALVAAVVRWRPGMFVVSQHVWSPQRVAPPTCLRGATARLKET